MATIVKFEPWQTEKIRDILEDSERGSIMAQVYADGIVIKVLTQDETTAVRDALGCSDTQECATLEERFGA